jgi:hypothetical protein
MGLVDTVKDMVVLVQKADNVDLLKQVLSLQVEALRTFEEMHALKERIRQLESQLETKRVMEFRAPFYFSGEDQIPFCPKCWESERKALHLYHTPQTRYECHSCKTVIHFPQDDQPSFTVVSRRRYAAPG